MSTSTEATIRLDVASFVDEVRRHLADLSAEEREELTGGLEADLTERLEESRAAGDLHSVLGDPRRYAEELRAAAGLGSSATTRGARWSAAAERLRHWSSAAGWPRIAGDFLVELRPAWWVLRAWIAVQALDYWFGSWPHDWIPRFGGLLGGLLLLLGAIVVSVQIGRGKWWPGTESTGWPRYLLVGANVFAVVMIPAILLDLPDSSDIRAARWWAPSFQPPPPHGLELHGDPVRNIYAYDANGRALVGVQLFDQDGNQLEASRRVQRDDSRYLVTYPWGLSQESDGLLNVYPLATRTQPGRGLVSDAFAEAVPPTVPAPPFVQVPAVVELTPEALEYFYAVTGTEPSADEADDTSTDKPQRDDAKRDAKKQSERQRDDKPGTNRDGRGSGKPAE